MICSEIRPTSGKLDAAFPMNHPHFHESEDEDEDKDEEDTSSCSDDSFGNDNAVEFATSSDEHDDYLANRTSEILRNYQEFLQEYDLETAAHGVASHEAGCHNLQYHEHKMSTDCGTDKNSCLLGDYSMHRVQRRSNDNVMKREIKDETRPLLANRGRFYISLCLGLFIAIVVAIHGPGKGTPKTTLDGKSQNRFSEVAYVLGREEGHVNEALPHHSSIITTKKLLPEPITNEGKQPEANVTEPASTSPLNKSTPTVQLLEPNEENTSYYKETNYLHNEKIETGEAAALANTEEVDLVSAKTEAPAHMKPANSHLFISEPEADLHSTMSREEGLGLTSATSVATKNMAPLDMTQTVHNIFKPLWLGSVEGWNGGSHDDAVEFCRSIRGKQLCPYSIMCPNGPGHSVMNGRKVVNFSVEGEQYAPAVILSHNVWVMVGEKDEDQSTTCVHHEELKMTPPSWGTSAELAEKKKHVMCCTIPTEM